LSYQLSAVSHQLELFASRSSLRIREISIVILSDEVAVATEESKDPYAAYSPLQNTNANSLSLLQDLCHDVNGNDHGPSFYQRR
jgi:hypothetical protein